MHQKLINEFIKVENEENFNSAQLAQRLELSHEETVSLIKSLEARFYFVLN